VAALYVLAFFAVPLAWSFQIAPGATVRERIFKYLLQGGLFPAGERMGTGAGNILSNLL
jgi:hypothetical protein